MGKRRPFAVIDWSCYADFELTWRRSGETRSPLFGSKIEVRLALKWFKRVALGLGVVMVVVLMIGLITWGRITHWGQSAEGSAELRARVGIVPFVITEPRLYRPFIGARVEGPLLFHERDGRPSYYKFLFRRGDHIIGAVHVNAQTMAFELRRFTWYYEDPSDLSDCPQHFPDPATPEEAMERAQKALSQYPDATPDEPFLYGIGGPEWWLIRVRRNREVIAWVTVSTWDGSVWELPPTYWDNPLSGW